VVQDSAQSAVAITLDDVVNDPMQIRNPHNQIGFAYGDARRHESAPTTRPNGRADWYQVTVNGAGDPAHGMIACLGITNFPSDDWFELCISDDGESTFYSAGCDAVQGGATSLCLNPPAMTDAGVYYVRVRKLNGSNTANGYALYLSH
jgi:hypothetical protein